MTETLTAPSGPVLFQGLPAGVYDVCYGPATNSNGAPIATSPNPAVSEVNINSTGSYSAVMLPSGITISGSLTYQVDGKVFPVGCKAAAGAACSPGSVTATWQYYDRTANPPTLLNGTFTTPIDSNGFFEFSNVPAGQQVASPTVNLQVSAGGFSSLIENNVPVPTCSAAGVTTTAQGSVRAGLLHPRVFPQPHTYRFGFGGNRFCSAPHGGHYDRHVGHRLERGERRRPGRQRWEHQRNGLGQRQRPDRLARPGGGTAGLGRTGQLRVVLLSVGLRLTPTRPAHGTHQHLMHGAALRRRQYRHHQFLPTTKRHRGGRQQHGDAGKRGHLRTVRPGHLAAHGGIDAASSRQAPTPSRSTASACILRLVTTTSSTSTSIAWA